MGCIEITAAAQCAGDGGRLIETWDVLKSKTGPCREPPSQINRNMGCIEIRPSPLCGNWAWRLIETWDVLKCAVETQMQELVDRLIETWDVLKLAKNLQLTAEEAD